ncbi:hypothetical protein MTR62_17430 [Novosphingobium sp. 1949]|uniref:FecR protein domain-containing protein n=1 Tax=Novosphingobium organovorum TaxID=2930092 RepID=A0ABT0BHE9_9SPHN|nr:hypothetical protein [Novosphingobium organovorum]MCJ2184459.1 hypothetical protein [Novosphingobium organovorum]
MRAADGGAWCLCAARPLGAALATARGRARITVLGTAFDVERRDAGTEQVRVYRGLVRVAKGDNSWELPAGSGLVVSGAAVQRRAGVSGARPDGMDGWFEAQDTPLATIVAQLDRVSPEPVVLAPCALGELRLSGRFRIADPPQTLDIICATQGLAWHREAGRIVLERSVVR